MTGAGAESSPAAAAEPPTPFEVALRAEPQATIEIERLWALFAASGPPPGDPDGRRDLAAALHRAAATGVIRLPSPRNRKLWQRERHPPLPAWARVVRPRSAAEPGETSVWHPLIAAAVERAGPGVRVPADLGALDRWLKSGAHGASLLPVQERSFEVFGDEKRLEVILASQFCVQGGLRAEDLLCFRAMEPFAMTAFEAAGTHAIALENLATYDSVVRAVESNPANGWRPAAVIFGSGNHFEQTCVSIRERLPRVRTLVYFGDLDRDGLEIALRVRRALAPEVAVVPWIGAYRAMLDRRRMAAKALEPRRAEALSAFFDDPVLRAGAAEALSRGERVPQEAVPRTELERMLPRP